MICKLCETERPETDFYRSRGRPTSPCKACHNAKSKAWYRKNKTQHQTLVRKWHKNNPEKVCNVKRELRAKLRALIDEIRSHTPCLDCGLQLPPWTMDFDHRPGETKIDNVSRMASRNVTLTQLRREIAKCDIVCGVCHAHRTYCRTHGIAWYPLTSA